MSAPPAGDWGSPPAGWAVAPRRRVQYDAAYNAYVPVTRGAGDRTRSYWSPSLGRIVSRDAVDLVVRGARSHEATRERARTGDTQRTQDRYERAAQAWGADRGLTRQQAQRDPAFRAAYRELRNAERAYRSASQAARGPWRGVNPLTGRTRADDRLAAALERLGAALRGVGLLRPTSGPGPGGGGDWGDGGDDADWYPPGWVEGDTDMYGS